MLLMAYNITHLLSSSNHSTETFNALARATTSVSDTGRCPTVAQALVYGEIREVILEGAPLL